MSDIHAPIGGAIYYHPKFRGGWRCEKAGPKWITLRSLTVVRRGGGWAVQRVAREDWPHGWYRNG